MIVLSNFYLDFSGRDFLSNGMYSDSMRRISVTPPFLQAAPQDAAFRLEYDEAEYYIYKNVGEDAVTDKRGVYFTRDFHNISQFIESGRFFRSGDFTNSVPVAVVGSDVPVFEENGKKYVGYNGVLYTVLGEFRKTDNILDFTTYFNLNSVLQNETVPGVYSIDGSKEVVERILGSIKTFIGDSLEVTEINYERFVRGVNMNYRLIFILSIAASFCNLLVICFYYINRQKYKTAILKLCGYTKKRILTHYIKSIFLTVCVAYSLSLIAVRFSNAIGLQQLNVYHFVFAFAVLILLGVFTSVRIALNIGRVDISSSLK
jgi:hypothetical protein